MIWENFLSLIFISATSCAIVILYKNNKSFQVDPRKKIDVGSYRIEGDGKQKLSAVKYAGSEVRPLSTLLLRGVLVSFLFNSLWYPRNCDFIFSIHVFSFVNLHIPCLTHENYVVKFTIHLYYMETKIIIISDSFLAKAE